MPETSGAMSPTDFVSTLSDYVAAKIKEDSAAGTRRSIKARFDSLGAHKQGLDLFLKLRKMEPADAELTLVSALRYCRWANLPFGSQAQLFGASDDAGEPAQKAAAALTEAVAYEEGYAAGKAGRDSDDSRFHAGTPLAERFYTGWCDGQEALGLQLGEDRPETGKLIKRRGKAKEGVEVRAAVPRGRDKGSRRSRGGAGAIGG